MDLTPQQQEVVDYVGMTGCLPTNRFGREFGELERAGLIVFWPVGALRPMGIFGGGTEWGRWYLTRAGAHHLGTLQLPPLRFAPVAVPA